MASPKFCILTISVCFFLTVSAADVDVSLETSADSVALGDEFDLYCNANVAPAELQSAEFSVNGNAFFKFDKDASVKTDNIEKHEIKPSSGGANSTVTVTLKASLCDDKKTARKYECKVTGTSGDEGQDEADDVTFTGDASGEVCSTAATTDAAAATDATDAPAGNNNGTTTAPSGDNIAFFGSAIALVIILVTAALLGLIGLWYCCLVKAGKADAYNIK